MGSLASLLRSSGMSAMNRRAFVQTSSVMAAAGMLPGRSKVVGSARRSLLSPIQRTATAPLDEALMRTVALRAIDAAKSAGATYADVRLVRQVSQVTVSRNNRGSEISWQGTWAKTRIDVPQSGEMETHAIAVRALVNGAWGFAASPWWTEEESVALAHDAVAQARDNAQWATTKVELAPATVATGSWTTPMRIDPFSIPIEDKMAFIENARNAYRPLYRIPDRDIAANAIGVGCQHTTRAVATSEGSYFVQHFYSTKILERRGFAKFTGITFQGDRPVWSGADGEFRIDDDATPSGTGWEAVADADLWTWGQRTAEEAYARLIRGPAKSVGVGQYTIVMDAAMVARLVDVTIGRATDMDRLVGDEANTGGTSYLGSDPLRLLGNYSFDNPMLTIHATRAATVGTVTGLPTVRWDDEGVMPTPFTLVKDGILQDLPTTRDRAMLLAPYYHKRGKAVVSNGCATSGSAFDLTTVAPPTLVVNPGSRDTTYDAMISSVPRGLVLRGSTGGVSPDYQLRQLTLSGEMQEIVNGRLGRFVTNGEVVINATQLWKNLAVLGSAHDADVFVNATAWEKGEPSQTLQSSVVAVPATFTNMPVVSAARRR